MTNNQKSASSCRAAFELTMFKAGHCIGKDAYGDYTPVTQGRYEGYQAALNYRVDVEEARLNLYRDAVNELLKLREAQRVLAEAAKEVIDKMWPDPEHSTWRIIKKRHTDKLSEALTRATNHQDNGKAGM